METGLSSRNQISWPSSFPTDWENPMWCWTDGSAPQLWKLLMLVMRLLSTLTKTTIWEHSYLAVKFSEKSFRVFKTGKLGEFANIARAELTALIICLHTFQHCHWLQTVITLQELLGKSNMHFDWWWHLCFQSTSQFRLVDLMKNA